MLQTDSEDSKSIKKLRQTILDRLIQTIEQELSTLSSSALLDLHSVDDVTALAKITIRKLSSLSIGPDRRLLMELEGMERFNVMVDAAGGFYTTEQVCKLLGATPNRIRKDAARKKLIQLKHAGRSGFPAFQFLDGKTLPGLSRVLKMLPAHISTVGTIRFFLTPVDCGDGNFQPLVELLRIGKEEYVVMLAAEYQTHLSV